MSSVQMQARSSSNGQLYTWVAASPDWAAAGFPGPGSAQDVALAIRNAAQPGAGLSVSGTPASLQAPVYSGGGAVWTDVARTFPTMAALRAFSPINGAVVHTTAFATQGDRGGGSWVGVTGAPAATYVHDGGRVIVPAGGNGSAAWVDSDPGTVRHAARWGVVANTGTDQTTAMAAALAAAKANGLTLVAPDGTILVHDLVLGGGAKKWGLVGAGKGLTIIKRVSGGTVMNCASSSVPFTLADFTLDCAYSTVPTGANHGISIGLVSGVRVKRISIIDHFGSACQIYDDAGTHRFFDNQILDCDCSGSGGNGQDGFLIANMDRSHIVNCYATGQNGSPGYGIQLKDVCFDCKVIGCSADNCIALLVFGNDTGVAGVERCTVTGFTGKAGSSTVAGFFGGHSQYCVLSDIAIDLNSVTAAYGIRLQNDIGNTFKNVMIKNLSGSRSAVYCDQTSTDNHVEVGHLENINTTGTVVEFHASATRNQVVLHRMTTPKVRSAGLHTEGTFNSSVENSYSHDGFRMYELCTLASDTATPRNMASELLIISGEGGAADNLATIDATYIGNRGKELAIKNANSTPTITVKSTGNIATTGGVDFALDDRKDSYSVRWVDDASKWTEVARANNG